MALTLHPPKTTIQYFLQETFLFRQTVFLILHTDDCLMLVFYAVLQA
jgi:hypothetical protein